jgi:hypothetical protein
MLNVPQKWAVCPLSFGFLLDCAPMHCEARYNDDNNNDESTEECFQSTTTTSDCDAPTTTINNAPFRKAVMTIGTNRRSHWGKVHAVLGLVFINFFEAILNLDSSKRNLSNRDSLH